MPFAHKQREGMAECTGIVEAFEYGGDSRVGRLSLMQNGTRLRGDEKQVRLIRETTEGACFRCSLSRVPLKAFDKREHVKHH